jgi:hypothetical protein
MLLEKIDLVPIARVQAELDIAIAKTHVHALNHHWLEMQAYSHGELPYEQYRAACAGLQEQYQWLASRNINFGWFPALADGRGEYALAATKERETGPVPVYTSLKPADLKCSVEDCNELATIECTAYQPPRLFCERHHDESRHGACKAR